MWLVLATIMPRPPYLLHGNQDGAVRLLAPNADYCTMKSFLRLLWALGPLGLSGCASLYFPPPPHAPMLTHQGEFYGGVSTNQHTNYALQGAYGLTNHLTVAGTFSSLHRKNYDKTDELDFGEASLGYFTRLPDKRVSEVYVGAGGGATQRAERNDAQITTRQLE